MDRTLRGLVWTALWALVGASQAPLASAVRTPMAVTAPDIECNNSGVVVVVGSYECAPRNECGNSGAYVVIGYYNCTKSCYNSGVFAYIGHADCESCYNDGIYTGIGAGKCDDEYKVEEFLVNQICRVIGCKPR